MKIRNVQEYRYTTDTIFNHLYEYIFRFIFPAIKSRNYESNRTDMNGLGLKLNIFRY